MQITGIKFNYYLLF